MIHVQRQQYTAARKTWSDVFIGDTLCQIVFEKRESIRQEFTRSANSIIQPRMEKFINK